MKMLLVLLLTTITICTNAQLPAIHSGVYHWNELPVKKDTLRESRKIMEGSTHEFSFFKMHASTMQKGAAAKPPHIQKDIEELIIIKEGRLTCTLDDQVAELGPESILIIPPNVSQTFENTGDGPVTYYVLQFRSKKPMDMERSNKGGGILMLNADTIVCNEDNGRGNQKYFDRPTAMCENYEMHITSLKKKGPSHAPHQHVDTEIILVIEGEVGMTIKGNDYKGGAGDLFIAESGVLHAVANASEKTCRYFAFKWR